MTASTRIVMLAVLARLLSADTNVWTPLGPDGASVQALAVDPNNPQTLYATNSAGLFKTTDAGANWSLLNSVLRATSLAVDPTNSNTIYLGVRGGGNSGAWMFKSTDGGANFNLANGGLEGVQFYGSVTVDPHNAGTVYAVAIIYLNDPCPQNIGCLITQVFKTTDGGGNWIQASTGLPVVDSLITSLAVDPQDSRVVYAGLYGPNNATSGVFKSTDGAASWSAINSSVIVCCTYFSQGLVVDPVNHDTIYAASRASVVKLSSAGTILSTTQLSGANITSLVIDPQAPGTLYAAAAGFSSNIFKTTDGGSSWTGVFPSEQFGAVFSLAIDPINSGTLYAGSTSIYGVIKTGDGGASWTLMSHGLGRLSVSSIAVDSQNSGTLYAVSGSVFKTTNDGTDWAVQRGSPNAASLLIDPRDSATLYANTSGYLGSFTLPGPTYAGGVFKSADGGTTWNEIGHASWVAANSALAAGHYLSIGTLIQDPQNPDSMYTLATVEGGGPGCCSVDLFKTADGGLNWSRVASIQDNPINSLVMDPQNSSTLYAFGVETSLIHKSADGGITWSASRLPPESSPTDDDDLWAVVRSLAVDPQDSNIVYVSGSGGIFKSSDGGATWTTMNSGLSQYSCAGNSRCFEPSEVDSVVVDPASTVYAIFGGTVLRSSDGAVSWSPTPAGLPLLSWTAKLTIDAKNPATLYVAADGVFTITLGQ
jgi:photosystem II stability/assembly factor-like uncharacterized protein